MSAAGVDARRFEALASAIAGRPLRVAWGDGPTWTDGSVIELDPEQPDRARDAVVLQAALLAGGALEPEEVRPLRGRERRIAAHLAREVPRCLAALGATLPPTFVLAPEGSAEAWWGTIRPGRLLAAPRTAGGAAPPVDVVGGPPAQPDPADADVEPAEESRRWALDRSLGMAGRSRRNRRRRRSSSIGELGDAGAPRAVLGWTAAAPPRLVRERGGPIVVVDAPGRPGHVATYPEWDEARQRYRADWCVIHEVPAATAPSGPVHRGIPPAVRRQLAAVHLDLAPVRRQPDGEDLDLDALVEHRVLVAAGHPGSGDVYQASRRRRRDLGVLVLLDGSGSTGKGRAGGASVTDRQHEAAAALIEASERLGDRVACHSFRSHGRKRVELSRIKGFDERFDTTARGRLDGLQPEGFTRLGPAIRHGAHLLRTGAGTRRWLLVVLSDGVPFDSGYEGAHASADARRALAEARAAGIGALCLSVGSATPADELLAVFGSTTYAAAASLGELHADLGRLARAALAGADRSRRVC